VIREIDVCRQCGKPKSWETFGSYVARHGPDAGTRKLKAICRDCERARGYKWRADNPERYREQARRSTQRQRERDPDFTWAAMLWRYHRLRPADYYRMLDDQRGICAGCGRVPSEGERLQVDHCHRTEKRRGLLCGPCNRALANVDDSIERLEGLIRYLQRL
jgi:hypothetical protein